MMQSADAHSRNAAEVLAYRMDEAERVSGLARTALFEAIARGDLKSFRAGKRRLILADSLREHLHRLADRTAA
jgi:hypothetical protein